MNGRLKNCCVCLENGIDLTPEIANTHDFIGKLRFCIPEIEWIDNSTVCKSCFSDLQVSYSFKLTCFKTYNISFDCIQNNTERSDIAQKSCQNIKTKSSSECNETKETKRRSKRNINKNINYEEDSLECCDYQNAVDVERKDLINIANEAMNNNESENSVECKSQDVAHAQLFEKINENDEVTDLFFHDNLQDSDSTSEESLSDFEFVVKEKRKKPVTKNRSEKKSNGSSKGPFTCEHCAKQFSRKEHLLSHIRVAHTFETPYHCDQCDVKFSISNLLLAHKRKEHWKQRPFICIYCGKGFLRSTDLCHHTKIHLNKRQYKCDLCNKGFNTASTLKSHNVCVHTDASLWKYPCSYCSRRFPMKSNLTAHLRRHTGEKKFSCHICMKSFYDKIMLQKHYRSHTDERLFNCHVCKKEYKDSCSLNVHLKKVHDIGHANVPVRKKNFICHMCPKAFVADDKLQRHIRTHTGIKPYECTLCNKKFNDSWYLRKHIKSKHNLDNVGNSVM